MAKLELKQKFIDLYLNKKWRFLDGLSIQVVHKTWKPVHDQLHTYIQSVPEIINYKNRNDTYTYFLQDFVRDLRVGNILWVN